MPVERVQQSSFASGEFDPLLFAREDVAFFYNSARRIENAIPLPQGGAKRREGLRFAGIQRGVSGIFQVPPTVTAANGGNVPDVYEPLGSATVFETTNAIGTTSDYEICKFAFFLVDPAEPVLAVVDIALAVSEQGTFGLDAVDIEVALEISQDDVSYTEVARLTVGTLLQLRRFARTPGTKLGGARYWRFVAKVSPGQDFGSAVMRVQAANFLITDDLGDAPNVEPGPVLVRKITTSAENEFWGVISDRTVDIYDSSGAWEASASIPHTFQQVEAIKTSQSRDTLVLYHEDQPPYIVQRIAAGQWRSGPFEIASVPDYPFGDATTGGQNEIQEIELNSIAADDRLAFEFNGSVSDQVTFSAALPSNAGLIETALETLPDITSVTVTYVSGTTYAVEFDGADAKQAFATLIVLVLSGSAVADVTRTQPGKPDADALWSAARGYPRCGTFYQGGHWMGGFKSAPAVVVRSRVGAFGDFKEDADPVASSPLVLEIDIDEQVEVENIYPGRNLQVFTSSAELFVPDEPITPDNVRFKTSSKRGCFPTAQPVDVQGGTLFPDRNGTALREYLFNEVEQSYTAEPVSILSGHLMSRPSSMTLRLASDTDEPTVLYLVNEGVDRAMERVPAAAVVIDRAQEVTAFARQTSSGGEFKAISALQGGEVAAVVQRTLNGVPAWNYFEVFDADHMGDFSVEIANTQAETFTGDGSQTVFTYTFTSPGADADVGVYVRATPDEKWLRATGYSLDRGAKAVTFTTAPADGSQVYIAPRETVAALGHNYLDGVEAYAHRDGIAAGAVTPAAGSVTVAAGFFFHLRVGLFMVPDIVLHPFKGRGGRSPTMTRQRIYRLLMSFERTTSVAVAIEGERPRPVRLANGGIDPDLVDLLYTGLARVSGVGGWQKEPRLRITQLEPGPFLMRSVTYDVRF